MFDIVTERKLFKDYISPTVVRQIAAKSKLWGMIKKSDKLQLGGRAAIQKVIVANSQATGAASTAEYPTAQQTTPEETLVYLKRAQMFQLMYDGFALESALKGGAAMDPMALEKEGIIETMIDDLSRQTIMDGSGHLCQANGGGGSAVLTVDHPYYADATKFPKPGRLLEAYFNDVTKEFATSPATVKSVDSATQITLVASHAWTTDAWIFNKNTFALTEAAATGEMMGLMGIISEKDPPFPNALAGLQGLKVATYPDWKAVVKTNGGVKRGLDEDLISSAIDDIETGEISVMFYTMKLRRVWAQVLRDYKVTDSKTMWGGWSGLPFYYNGREIPMIADRFIPDGHLLGLDESKLTLFVTDKKGEITWEEARDGSYLQKVAGFNQFVAEGHIFGNIGVSVRKSFFKIDDLSEPTS